MVKQASVLMAFRRELLATIPCVFIAALLLSATPFVPAQQAQPGVPQASSPATSGAQTAAPQPAQSDRQSAASRPAISAPPAPQASGARILLLPRQIVSGERATLAVLDVNGRLTPGVDVTFSNGDRLKTDATGRALFVAPLTPGVIFGSIAGRAGRVTSVVLSPAEAAAADLGVTSVPRVASISDRFDVLGHGFCGDADANQVSIGGQPALVLASSPLSLVLLPPPEAEPGATTVAISCSKRAGAPFAMTFVELALEADSSPLAHAEHRALRVTVRGSSAKLLLEARNLAPDVADLTGGNPVVRQLSSGGADNAAKFEVVGKKKGSFLISIRLISPSFHPGAQ
jgi:hypothetical protein